MLTTTLPDTLRRRLLLYAAAALLLMAVWVAGTVSLPLLESWKSVEKANLLYKTRFKAQILGEWLEQHRHLARQLAARTDTPRYPEEIQTEERIARLRQSFRDFLRQSPDVVGVSHLDEEGRLLVAEGMRIPEELLALPAVPASLVRLSELPELRGVSCLLFYTPLRSREGRDFGVDIMAVNITALYAQLGERSTGLGMMQGNAARWLWLGSPITIEESILDKVLRLALHGENGIFPARGRVIAYAPVPGSSWGFILPVKTADLYAPAWTNLHLMFVYVGLVYVLCLAGFLLLSRPLAGKILLHAHELEETIATRNRQLQEELSARARMERELETTRNELEDRVRSRTDSLIQTNMALREEQTRRKELSRRLINMVEELRPARLDSPGLLPSLETLVEEYRQTGLKVIFFHKDIPETLDKERSRAIYRIAQEALTNVLRHAEAQAVHMNFTLRNTMFTLSIEDDGHGFDVEAATRRHNPMGHLGLMLIRERADLLDGDCAIDAFPGRGTHIMVRIPHISESI